MFSATGDGSLAHDDGERFLKRHFGSEQGGSAALVGSSFLPQKGAAAGLAWTGRSKLSPTPPLHRPRPERPEAAQPLGSMP